MPRSLIEKRPSIWPWCTTIYLVGFTIVALVANSSETCHGGGWGFLKVTFIGTVLAPAVDTVVISRRRRDTGLAMAVGGATLVVALAVFWFVSLLRTGSAGCFD